MEYGVDVTDSELALCEGDGFPPPFKLRSEVAASPTPPRASKRRIEEVVEDGMILEVADDTITEVILDKAAKDQVCLFRKRLVVDALKADDFELVDRRYLPEILAGTLVTPHCAKKKEMERATALTRQLLHLFSYEEKRRFLKVVARNPKTDMIVWFDLMEWSKFDALMIVNRTSYDTVVRRVVRRLEDDPATLMVKLATWLDFKRPQVLDLLRQSAFNNPTYEGYNLGRLERPRIEKFIQAISGYNDLPFPSAVTLSRVTKKLDRLLSVFPKQELSPRDLILSINQAVDAHPSIRCMADAIVGSSDLGATYESYKDVHLGQIPHEDACWASEKCPSAEYLMETIDDAAKAPAIIHEIRSNNSAIPIVFRLSNQIVRQQRVVAVMFQLRGPKIKYRLDTFDRIDGFRRDILDAIFSKSVYTCDVNYVALAATYTFGIDERVINDSFVRVNNGKSRGCLMLPGPKIMSKALRIEYCPCTRQRVVRDVHDTDSSFWWHMANELDVLARFEVKKRCS